MLAKVVARYARFLRPEIVQAIVEDNQWHSAAWSGALEKRGIDPRAYLWPRSACAFPGVRRYAGSSEIAILRGFSRLLICSHSTLYAGARHGFGSRCSQLFLVSGAAGNDLGAVKRTL